MTTTTAVATTANTETTIAIRLVVTPFLADVEVVVWMKSVK
jgi:hypothetical protein